mgnify:CR=1 FL=1|tara:strand:- start:1011 stop:1769 length:759 start_codon:yes stop_codon:yes gene_type:complete
MGKFFTVDINPIIPVAGQIQSNKDDLVFTAGDVLFDWVSFDIPKGTCMLRDIIVTVRGGQTAKDVEFYFAKTYDGKGPSSLSLSATAENNDADGYGYFKNMIGGIVMDNTNFKTDLNNMVVGSLGHGAAADQHSTLMLTGEPNSGTNVGYDRLYIGATTSQSSGWNFSTGVLSNADVALNSASTFVTNTVDPRLFFDVGDVVHLHDNQTAIGTVLSLTDNDINLTANNAAEISTSDEIINASPISIRLCCEV